jgi:hypothetical protein
MYDFFPSPSPSPSPTPYHGVVHPLSPGRIPHFLLHKANDGDGTSTMIASSAPNLRGSGSNRPPTTDGVSIQLSQPATPTPPRGGGGGGFDDYDDNASVARAAAEVSVMPPSGMGGGVGVGAGAGSGNATGGGGGGRARPPGAEAAAAAIQGTSGLEGGEASAFEVVDEGGELVRVRFQEFLIN